MKKKTLSLTLLLCSTSAFAQTQYYGGEYECRDRKYYVNLAVTLGKPSHVSVWYREDPYRFEGFSGDADWTTEGGEIHAYSRSLRVKGKQAEWRSGKNPNKNCKPFTLTDRDAPEAEYRKFIEAVKTPPETADDIRKIITARFTLPPYEMLPDLDRTLISEEYKSASQAYWENVFSWRAEKIRNMPIEGDGSAYVAAVKPLLDDDVLYPENIERPGNWHNHVHNLSNKIAYRLAFEGKDPKLAQRQLDDAFCQRARNMGSNMYVIDETATGLPFAFWTRDFAQQVINQHRVCNQDWAENWLIKNYPKVEAQAKTYVDYIEKVKAWLALPDEYSTYSAVRDLVNVENQRELQNHLDYLDEISGGAFSAKLENIEKATLADMDNIIRAQLAKEPDSSEYSVCSSIFKDINNETLTDACRQAAPALIETLHKEQAIAKAEAALKELVDYAKQIKTLEEAQAVNWLYLPDIDGISDTLRVETQAALAPEQARIAAMIEQAAADAIQNTPNEEIGGICPSTYSKQMPEVVSKAMENCASKIAAHNESVRTKACDGHVQTAGAQEIEQETILIRLRNDREERLTIREIVCEFSDAKDAGIKIGSEAWIGKSREITVKYPEFEITGEIEPDKEGIWLVTEVKDWKPKDSGTPIDMCLFDADDNWCEKAK